MFVAFSGTFLALVSGSDAPGWELLVTSIGDPTPRTCHDTPGLPEWLGGNYMVAGPAKWEVGQTKMPGIFDGFGMLNRFEIGNNQVCFTSAWMDTMYHNQSETKGFPVGMIFEHPTPDRPSCPLLKPECNMNAGGDNNWVNIISVGGELLMLSDTPVMMPVDVETLKFSGIKPWLDDKEGSMSLPTWINAGHVATTGSAHPVQRPGTSTWVDIISELGPLPTQHSFIDVYTFQGDIEATQERTKLASVKLKQGAYVHSFGVTPNYVVISADMAMSMTNMNPLNPELLGSIVEQWQGIHVVSNQGVVTEFQTEAFTHVHIINSFENATGVTMDVGAYLTGSPFSKSGAMDIPMFLNKSARNSNPLRAVPRRIHLHLSGPLAGKAVFQDFTKIAGSHTDFYKTNPAFIGMPYCFYYGTQWWHDGLDYTSMAIMKHDLCTDTTTYWSRPGHYVGEPFFIAGPSGDEDDGVVIFVALDGPNGRSTLVTLDAKSMQQVNGTAFELEGHIPFTAHGNFFPSAVAMI